MVILNGIFKTQKKIRVQNVIFYKKNTLFYEVLDLKNFKIFYT